MHYFTGSSPTVEDPMLKIAVGNILIEWRTKSGANLLSASRYGDKTLVWVLNRRAIHIGPRGGMTFAVDPAAAWDLVTELRALRFKAASSPEGTE
jgi:hypothetical protein